MFEYIRTTRKDFKSKVHDLSSEEEGTLGGNRCISFKEKVDKELEMVIIEPRGQNTGSDLLPCFFRSQIKYYEIKFNKRSNTRKTKGNFQIGRP